MKLSAMKIRVSILSLHYLLVTREDSCRVRNKQGEEKIRSLERAKKWCRGRIGIVCVVGNEERSDLHRNSL